MNSDTKRLAIVATIFFFPTAIAGWVLYNKSSSRAIKLFRISIYIAVFYLCCLGAYAVTRGNTVVEALGTFF